MFSKAKSLVKNHWKKVLYGGIAFQVASYGLQYATKRVLKHHQEKAKEVWIQMKKREHFDKIHSNSLSTFVTLLPLLKDKIEKCLNSEALTASLKDKTTNKLQVWEELKIIAFSRMLATIYGSSLLCILLNIQLSVIGGYLIQDSCSKKLGSSDGIMNNNGGSGSQNSIDTDLQHEYLSLSDYFVQEGIEKLCTLIYNETKKVVGPISLKRKLTFNEFEQILWHIISLLKSQDDNINESGSSYSFDSCFEDNSNNPVKNSWKYIFPSRILDKYGNFRILRPYRPNSSSTTTIDMEELIMTETYDLLKSQDVEFLMKSFETHGVSSFLDRLVDVAASSSQISATTTVKGDQANNNNENDDTSNDNNSKPKQAEEEQQQPSSSSATTTTTSISSSQNNYILPHEVSIPLAKLIPLVNSFFPSSLNPSDPWVISITEAEKLRDFSANVYESFSSPFAF